MDIQFRNYIHHEGCYTRGTSQRSGPENLTGKWTQSPDLLEHSPREVFEGVSKTGTWTEIQANLKATPLEEGNPHAASAYRMMEAAFARQPQLQVGQKVSAAISAALGGVPVALGAASIYHPEDMFKSTMFSAKYYQAGEDGLPLKSNRDSADGTVYIDAGSGTLYIHDQATDPRWK